MTPWSVSLRAGWPKAAARAARASILHAPSRSEYSEWTWRWAQAGLLTAWAMLGVPSDSWPSCSAELAGLAGPGRCVPVRVWSVLLIVLLTGCGGGSSTSSRFAADETAMTTLHHDLDGWGAARAAWARPFRPETLRLFLGTARPAMRRMQGAFADLRDDPRHLRDRSVREVAGRLVRLCGRETDA